MPLITGSIVQLTNCGLVKPYGDIDISQQTQVMACCLTVPCHYLNQCWLIIREDFCHPRAISQEMFKISILDMILKITENYNHIFHGTMSKFIITMLLTTNYIGTVVIINFFDAGDGIFPLCGVNTMPADELAPKVASASADMILTV